MSSSESFVIALFNGLATLLNTEFVRPFMEMVIAFLAISMFFCLFRRK